MKTAAALVLGLDELDLGFGEFEAERLDQLVLL